MHRLRLFTEIPTPALLVDVPALQRNIGRMAEFFATGSCRLRPHFKAHKTPEIARRQLAAGSCVGLTCATVGEAEVVAELCDDVLIANEIIGPGKADRVAALARGLRVTVAIDSAAGLEEIGAAARRAGVVIGALVDVNVGQGRCGVPPGEDVVALARQVTGVGSVQLHGLMGYEGHVQAVRSRVEREARTREAMQALLGSAKQLLDAGLPCEVVSAGGSGTYDISGRIEGITEIQAGSYALMDTDYTDVGLPFESALSVVGTVISRPAPDRCVVDCGHKSVTKDHGLPAVKNIAGSAVTALNDEHAVISIPSAAKIQVGDRLELLPSHIDPTVNLHDVLYAIADGRIVDVWPIAARGYPEHRRTGS